VQEGTLTYHAHGKVNLYLDVLDRRRDGYHNIETIFQSVGLHDTLTFTPQAEGVVCTCSDAGVPCDERNLAVKAALRLRQLCGVSTGVHIHITKRIPVAGGMAGGSANAAATLVALNEFWGLGLKGDSLPKLALELGSDVPFCLRGGSIAATGRGEVFLQLPPLPENWFVLVMPGIPIGAGELYNHPDLEHSLEENHGGFTPAFLHAMDAARVNELDRVVFNRMESAAFVLHPDLERVKEMLLEAGCMAAAMSGSGSTMFGVCETRAQAESIAALDFGYPAIATPSTQVGVRHE
jgi:4-diphosphocytidyl-2-C-methyl-D-erythritol kinase